MSSVYSNPVTVLIARMAAHATTGGLLEGFRWYDAPTEHPDGQKDFPSVQLWLPEITETYSPRLGTGELKCNLTVSVLRSTGLAGLLDAVSAVMNAVETRENGQINPGLAGTLMRPVDMTAGNCFASPLSLTAEVTLVMQPKIFDRGQR